MTKRRRFTAEFKPRVALDALRVDQTVQEIAAKRKVHPNQVSTGTQVCPLIGSATDSRDLPPPRPELGDKRTSILGG